MLVVDAPRDKLRLLGDLVWPLEKNDVVRLVKTSQGSMRLVGSQPDRIVMLLPAICATALRSRREDQNQHQQHAGRAWQDNGLVFTTRLGTPIEPRNFHREFKTPCRKAGVREISVHTTRRTCASLLVALDVHPRVTMQILRHSQIAVTMNIYSEVAGEATEKALKRLGEQFI